MKPSESRAISHLLFLAKNDLIFDLELVTAFSTLRETYGLATLLRMIEDHIKPELLTAHEWNKKLDYRILDYDGFRDGTITTETKITEDEFRRRAVKATRNIGDQLRKCSGI